MNPRDPLSPAAPRSWKTWNQKLHIYLGLFFLVLLWLFALSGLLLNHGWQFAEFWAQRKQTSREQRITLPTAVTELLRAQAVMQQLGLAGEIEWTTTRATPDRFDFRVQRPGRTVDVRVDALKGIAVVDDIRVNGWGVFRSLHTFTGTRANAPTAQRDWWLTKLWSLAMDALAVGLVLMVLTSVALGVERREKWRSSAVALGLGVGACGFFVVGLGWL